MNLDPQISQTQINTITDVIVEGNFEYRPTQIIQVLPNAIKGLELNLKSPYKRLEKFTDHDSEYLFGRDRLIFELINSLEKNFFTLLIGASGSGKSSVVLAGLIPRLRKGLKCTTLVFRPDRDPFRAFSSALEAKGYGQDRIDVTLGKRDDRALSRVVKSFKIEQDQYWLIYIDQLEELFAISKSDRDLFIRNLKNLNQKDKSIRIIMTIRSDFSNDLSTHSKLDKLIGNKIRIPDMDQNELRMAIEQPAAHHGVVFEDELVTRIINDIQGQIGYLSFLQFTLDLLWGQESKKDSFKHERTLYHKTYGDLGGVRGALQKHVTRIYEGFEKKQQLTAQYIFLRLVGIGGDERLETEWKPIRQRVEVSKFQDALEKEVIAKLVNERLLVTDGQSITQQSTIEIAHEILFDAWETLKIWIRENRKAIAIRNRLNHDVNLWLARKKSENELWRGVKLEQVTKLKGNVAFTQVLGGFSLEANRFIDASLNLKNRQKRRRMLVLSGVTCLFVVSLIIGHIAWLTAKEAEEADRRFVLGIDPPTPKLLERLDGYLTYANQLQLNNEKDLDNALKYYRRILSASDELQMDIQLNPQKYSSFPKGEEDVLKIREQVERLIIQAITEHRLPIIKTSLDAGNFGRRKTEEELIQDKKSENPNFDPIEDEVFDYLNLENNFTEGALRYTYSVLMGDFGLGADSNKNGMLDQSEASRIPCVLLDEIEKLWREATSDHCGWYGEDFDVAAKCGELAGWTLTTLIFEPPYDIVLDRLNQCGIR